MKSSLETAQKKLDRIVFLSSQLQKIQQFNQNLRLDFYGKFEHLLDDLKEDFADQTFDANNSDSESDNDSDAHAHLDNIPIDKLMSRSLELLMIGINQFQQTLKEKFIVFVPSSKHIIIGEYYNKQVATLQARIIQIRQNPIGAAENVEFKVCASRIRYYSSLLYYNQLVEFNSYHKKLSSIYKSSASIQTHFFKNSSLSALVEADKNEEEVNAEIHHTESSLKKAKLS